MTGDICSLPSETPGSASSNLLDFLLKRKWTHKHKNKEKQKHPRTLLRLYPVFIYFDREVSLGVGREQKLFPFLSFMLLELLSLGNVFFSLKPSSVRLCTFAVPWFGQGREWVLIFGTMLKCWQIKKKCYHSEDEKWNCLAGVTDLNAFSQIMLGNAVSSMNCDDCLIIHSFTLPFIHS